MDIQLEQAVNEMYNTIDYSELEKFYDLALNNLLEIFNANAKRIIDSMWF